jgi:hypothetical protein
MRRMKTRRKSMKKTKKRNTRRNEKKAERTGIFIHQKTILILGFILTF